ncbi:MAG: acyltransferase [Paracoccaceae bacterium]
MTVTEHISHPGQVSGDLVAINSLRTIAFTMLVSYHVVGLGTTSGLGLDYPHFLRFYADYLIHVRMPIFAVIAGFVYGMRPVQLPDYGRFIGGKIRRLLIPGAIAALIFALAGTLMGNRFARTTADIWEIFFFPYAHYWYLQTMMVIFVGSALADALLKGRHTHWLFLGACAFSLSSFWPPVFFSLRTVPFLLPFFLFGVVLYRNFNLFYQARTLVLGLCLLAVLSVSYLQAQHYWAEGTLMLGRRTPSALVFGVAACTLLFLAMPRIALLDRLAPFAFTIYLYHIFGTSGMREVLEKLGVDALMLKTILGLIAGIALPIVVHKLAEKTGLTRRLVLGMRK